MDLVETSSHQSFNYGGAMKASYDLWTKSFDVEEVRLGGARGGGGGMAASGVSKERLDVSAFYISLCWLGDGDLPHRWSYLGNSYPNIFVEYYVQDSDSKSANLREREYNDTSGNVRGGIRYLLSYSPLK